MSKDFFRKGLTLRTLKFLKNVFRGSGFAADKVKRAIMHEIVDENHFTVRVNDKIYNVNVSYEGVYVSHYKIETDGDYLVTLCMDEEGNWQAENDSIATDKRVIEQIGRAIEQHDGR